MKRKFVYWFISVANKIFWGKVHTIYDSFYFVIVTRIWSSVSSEKGLSR